ncbi:MAG: carbon-nitrogen hydrolase [Candidatus Micrarchaeota archaeon]|nr:carbon-nitrogen hydrolase [Candidatus Micrarchaeota archaeon]
MVDYSKISNKEQNVKVAVLQLSCVAEVKKNMANALKLVSEAADKGAQIVCLPELYRSLYFPQEESHKNFELSESIPGASTDAFAKLAKEKKVVVIVPIFEKRTQGLHHNSAVVINADGKVLGNYRKMHIPDDPCFYEKFYFAPGDTGFKVFDTAYGKVSVLICWDQWYPEAARVCALKGAQFIFYPTAIGWHKSETKENRSAQLSSWQIIQRSHAIANGVFVCVSNRFGKEGDLTFWGNSFIAAPNGTVVASGSQDKEEILISSCNLSDIDSQREGWPFLRDRRIDTYADVLKRFADE